MATKIQKVDKAQVQGCGKTNHKRNWEWKDNLCPFLDITVTHCADFYSHVDRMCQNYHHHHHHHRRRHPHLKEKERFRDINLLSQDAAKFSPEVLS